MISDSVLRRGAMLAELSSLGLSATMAHELTGIHYQTIYETLRKCGVKMPLGSRAPKRVNHIRAKVLRDFGKLDYGAMAERYGSTRASINSAVRDLRKMGLLPEWRDKCTHHN